MYTPCNAFSMEQILPLYIKIDPLYIHVCWSNCQTIYFNAVQWLCTSNIGPIPKFSFFSLSKYCDYNEAKVGW